MHIFKESLEIEVGDTWPSLADTRRHELKKKMMSKFAITSPAALEMAETKAYVAEVIYEFLSQAGTSSDISLDELAAKFRSSIIPLEPSEIDRYLRYLAETVVAHSTRTSSANFIGHMTTALPDFTSPVGEIMTALNQNPVKLETAKAVSFLERQTLAMMHRLIFKESNDFYDQHIQNGESTLGVLTSGGTLANLTALWCARSSSFGPDGDFEGLEHEGLPATLEYYGFRGAVIIGSELMHYSVEKAAGILGFGKRGLIKVAVDPHNRIDLKELRRTIAECRRQQQHIVALVGIAGCTDSGSIDPLAEMADIAFQANVHFHVDAAWGGALLFSEEHAPKLDGIEQADSVTIDGHKQLYLPMGIGVLALRDPKLAKVIEKQAPYILRANSIDLGKRSPEGSRPAMCLFLHAALNLLGCAGYEFLIDEGVRKTRHMARVISDRPEFELLIEPEMNILNYRYLPKSHRTRAARNQLTPTDNQFINHCNEQLQKAQRRMGKTFVSRTTLGSTRYGRGVPISVLRSVIANPLTAESDIDSILNEQVKIAAALGY